MKKSELRNIINEELKTIIETREVNQSDARKFLTDVLRMGSKNNLFDMYLDKNKISKDSLHDLVKLVGQELLKW